MAKQRKSAAKIAHQRRKSKRKPGSKKKKELSKASLSMKKIVFLAIGLFIFGYSGTLVLGLFNKVDSPKTELTPSVVNNVNEPSLFDRVIDRLLDHDLPHLRKERKTQKKIAEPTTVKTNKKEEIQKPAQKKRADLPVLKLSEEKEIAQKKSNKEHLSKRDKKKLDQLLSKYGF